MKNVIRTTAVELNEIPAIAYKMKLSTGGAGVKILRLDQDATASFTIDKRTGEGIAYGPVNTQLFPAQAVDEALELTEGLPYSSRGKINVQVFQTAQPEDEIEESTQQSIDIIGSDEYLAIVERYDDENGRLNYRNMNKEFIQFCSKSKVVAEMVADKRSVDDILNFVVKSRATSFANKKESLSDMEIDLLIETLDEMAPRSAFKETKAHIKKMLARA